MSTSNGYPAPAPARRWHRAAAARAGIASACAGRVVWLLGGRCVELLLPSGELRQRRLHLSLKAGSRAVADPGRPGHLYLLENGSSAIWHCSPEGVAECLTSEPQGRCFRASLGSRFLFCGRKLLVTGTPNQGAHSPWLFDLADRTWVRLPDAPYAILSSAVVASPSEICILGGWSKMHSCHGFLQRFSLKTGTWEVSSSSIPWRRPGAAAVQTAGSHDTLVAALGWMECDGTVGHRDFRLFRRNGGAQRDTCSSSRLVALAAGQVEELARLPLADSFESLGELFHMGHHLVCIGRDHVQIFDQKECSWQTWPLPEELSRDESNSWVKHCGSWAVAFVTEYAELTAPRAPTGR